MYKTLLLIIASCLFALNAYAEPRMDYVDSVKLDGMEVAHPVNIQSLPKAFWTGAVTQNGCTANYEVYVEYKNRKIRLEFFPEENPGLDLGKVFAKKTGQYMKYPLKARVWVEWDDMQEFIESLEVGNKLIKPDLTFDEFKKMFPVSAGYEEPYTSEYLSKNSPGTHLYDVTIGESLPDEIEPPYMGSVRFYFKNEKLFRLEIFQGLAC